MVKVVRTKTSRQVSKSSYCSVCGKRQYLKPTGHMVRDRGGEGRGVGLEALQGLVDIPDLNVERRGNRAQGNGPRTQHD